ncbi:hypothetical protein HN51_008731 [Arachis hypogaea]
MFQGLWWSLTGQLSWTLVKRGLSFYYLDRFEEGAEQFQLDVAQNPNESKEKNEYVNLHKSAASYGGF